jgi:hypothetical protein
MHIATILTLDDDLSRWWQLVIPQREYVVRACGEELSSIDRTSDYAGEKGRSRGEGPFGRIPIPLYPYMPWTPPKARLIS